MGSDIQNGSADQVAAQKIGAATRFPSIELGCEDSRTVGNCDSGYSCAYTNSIMAGPDDSDAARVNPRMAFERLFEPDDLSLDPATRARRLESRKSILGFSRSGPEPCVHAGSV
jgi:hypothetical protein